DGLPVRVAGPGPKPGDRADGAGGGRAHDDADRAAAFAHPACERDPVLAGKANVEQDDSRQLTLDERAQRRPAVDAGDTEIVFAEVLDQQMALGALVLDHDDMWPVVRH